LFTELAVDTFLQAALSDEIMFPPPEVSPGAWIFSRQGKIFFEASIHALSILKTWQMRSAASAESRHPEIRRLGLRLTELLRHDLLATISQYGTSNHFTLAALEFPWYGALECFVDCMPAEMGDLLRFAMPYSERDKWGWRWDRLNALAALFPSNSDANNNLESIILRHRSRRSHSAHEPDPEGTALSDMAPANETTDAPSSGGVTLIPGPALAATTEGSLHHPGVSDLSTEPEIGRQADVQASDPGQNHLDADVASRATSTVAIRNRASHHAIDMPPAVLLEPKNVSPANVAQDHSRMSPERDSRHPAHQQAAIGVSQPIGHDSLVGDGPVEGVDKAHLSDEVWSNV
jgi:hypothetical protein